MTQWIGSKQLAPGLPDIHVWFASLAVSQQSLEAYQHVLSTDERVLAARFRFDIHRSRFVAARGILRTLAARYVGAAPQDIQFLYGMNGKPELRGLPLHFNLSHSEDRGVFAFTGLGPVGIDLERVRGLPDIADIANRFFSADEAAALSAVPYEGQSAAFFRCWTRKEAFIKATGQGLSCPLDRFAVSLDDWDPTLLYVDQDTDEAQAWSMYHLAPEEGYIGALAIRRRQCALTVTPFRE